MQNDMRGLRKAVSQRQGRFSPRGKGGEDQGLRCREATWKEEFVWDGEGERFRRSVGGRAGT